MRLAGKVALVTGAGRGIGKAIATRLAEEGSKVVINDIDLPFAEDIAKRLCSAGREALAISADVSNSQEVEGMFKQASEHFGGIDILVNNAGIRRDAHLNKIPEKDWDTVIAVQLKGSFNCTRVAQTYMVRKNYGKIVNLSSPIPASLNKRMQTSYASVNAAIEGFTKALALELGPYSINVNCVAPDFIDTEMTRNAARKEGMYMDDFRKLAIAQIPLRRIGTTQDVANAIVFLVSDESSFISGQVIYIKGGP